MKKTTLVLGALLVAGAAAIDAAQALVGQPAPDFTVPDAKGKPETLSSFKGKWVVLEWTNPDCPFVQKHYDSGNMQKLQKTYTGKGVTWLTINSSAPGKEGYVDAARANAFTAERGASPSAFLLDPAGTVGRLYGAKATPHMFVIDPTGKLVYQGAIDDKPSTDLDDVKTARNYVSSALDEAMAGKPVSRSSSAPYGCSVKY